MAGFSGSVPLAAECGHLRIEQFTPQDRNLTRSLDANAYFAPGHFGYMHHDTATDDDPLTGLPAQNQHVIPP